MTLNWHLVGLRAKYTMTHAAPLGYRRTFCGRRSTVDVVAFGALRSTDIGCLVCRKVASAMPVPALRKNPRPNRKRGR